MNTVNALLIVLIISTTNAMSQIYDDLADAAGKRLLLEPNLIPWSNSFYTKREPEVQILTRLITSENAPPDLVEALRSALPEANVIEVDGGTIRITDKSLPAEATAVLEGVVSVNNFSGTVSELFDSLSHSPVRVKLIDTFEVGEDPSPLLAMDYQLTDFTYEGSLRDLLNEIAAGSNAACGYAAATMSRSEIVVSFFPESKLF